MNIVDRFFTKLVRLIFTALFSAIQVERQPDASWKLVVEQKSKLTEQQQISLVVARQKAQQESMEFGSYFKLQEDLKKS